MKHVAFVGYCRTEMANAFRGAFTQTHGIPLAATCSTRRWGAKVEGTEIEDVMLGCGLPKGATGYNIGRTARLEAGSMRRASR
ncbi:MAG: hypothetical protein ABL956_06935 [Hyphomonadaceae bacterium]